MNNVYAINENLCTDDDDSLCTVDDKKILFTNPSLVLLAVSKYGIEEFFELTKKRNNFNFYSKNKNFIEYLLTIGADINYQDQYGNSPLLYACYYNNQDIIILLLKYGANVNIIDIYNNSAMDMAYSTNNLTIANILVDYNIDLYKTNSNNNIPLFWKYMDLLLNTE